MEQSSRRPVHPKGIQINSIEAARFDKQPFIK